MFGQTNSRHSLQKKIGVSELKNSSCEYYLLEGVLKGSSESEFKGNKIVFVTILLDEQMYKGHIELMPKNKPAVGHKVELSTVVEKKIKEQDKTTIKLENESLGTFEITGVKSELTITLKAKELKKPLNTIKVGSKIQMECAE
ncbi:MAG: hypothetical protein NZ455_04685 [Bacteroidia bacterium]|nr:hypothetical protein [Bacteroidia bacterium]MDW8346131.1 hypothetical protein [Bacteroidia bacterium]